MSKHKVPGTPSIRRLPVYYHRLLTLQKEGKECVSTTHLAQYISMEQIVVRKDLELTGVKGHPGVGYKISDLLAAIRKFLGWDKPLHACLVGAGSLGRALLGFREFAEYGLNIDSVFDSDSAKIGGKIFELTIQDAGKMTEILKKRLPEVAILCVPWQVAQSVADQLVSCGIKLFWNFSNVCLHVPPDVIVQRELIAGGFAVLCRKRLAHAAGQDDHTQL